MKVVDYYGYKVYEDGTILGLRGNKLKPSKTNSGYYCVGISIPELGLKRPFAVHQVVAFAFLGLKPGQGRGMDSITVNHKDRDKSNNHVSNLELVTKRENIRLARKHNLPQYISKHRKGYQFHFTIDKAAGKQICRYFSTVEDAVAYRDDFFANKRAS